MNGLENSTNAPLFITREGLQDLIENFVNDASRPPMVTIHDGFLELSECDWCHRRMGEAVLHRGLCPRCTFTLRGAIVIANHLKQIGKGA